MSKPGPAFSSPASIPAICHCDHVPMLSVSCLRCKVSAPGFVLLGKIHSSTLWLSLALGASSPLGANHSLQVSVCVLFCLERREHLTRACGETSLQRAPVRFGSRGVKCRVPAPRVPPWQAAVSSSSICRAEERMDTAFHRNMLQPRSWPGGDPCAAAVGVGWCRSRERTQAGGRE